MTSFLTAVLLDAFEQHSELARIGTGFDHHLDSESIGLALHFARIGCSQTGGEDVGHAPREERQREAGRQHLFRVLKPDMSQFVRHQPGYFCGTLRQSHNILANHNDVARHGKALHVRVAGNDDVHTDGRIKPRCQPLEALTR